MWIALLFDLLASQAWGSAFERGRGKLDMILLEIRKIWGAAIELPKGFFESSWDKNAEF